MYADAHRAGLYRLPGEPAEMRRKFDDQKSKPEYQALVQSAQIVGMYDDHDFGINDGHKANPVKDIAQQLVLRFLDEPADRFARGLQDCNDACAVQSALEATGSECVILIRTGRQALESDSARRPLSPCARASESL